MILDMGHSFVGLLALYAGSIGIIEQVLNHLDRKWFSDIRQSMKVPFDPHLIVNLVRTSVEIWVNDNDLVRLKACSTPLKEIEKKIRDQNCRSHTIYQITLRSRL